MNYKFGLSDLKSVRDIYFGSS